MINNNDISKAMNIHLGEIFADLPDMPDFVDGIRRAPARHFNLTQKDTELALKNALRYVPAKWHATLAPEFLNELLSRGRIYGYRFRPAGRLKGQPVEDYRGNCLEANADEFGINPEVFEKYNVHIHVPEGATPKDGPSAGVTMLTSLVSLFTQRKVKKSLAMTGEITLRGKVLPVGGIKEKILAAKRARIKEILLSVDNKRDIEEIKQEYLTGLTFHYVSDMSDVLQIALTKQKVRNAKKL